MAPTLYRRPLVVQRLRLCSPLPTLRKPSWCTSAYGVEPTNLRLRVCGSFQRGTTGVTLDLIQAPPERHWRLINGGHVDVAPELREEVVERLRNVPTVRLITYSGDASFVLLIGQLEPRVRAAIIANLDGPAVAAKLCGDCAATMPIEHDPLTLQPKMPVDKLTLIYMSGARTEADAAELVAHQLLQAEVDVSVNPVSIETLNASLLGGTFELALAPVPSDPGRFKNRLAHLGYSLEDANSRVVPLWNAQFFAAVDTAICGANPTTPTTWAWLADLYRCEDDEL